MDSANYLKDACEKLEAIRNTHKTESEEMANKKPTEIRKAFEELVTCLRRAESVLVLPQQTTALQIYNAEQKVQWAGRTCGLGAHVAHRAHMQWAGRACGLGTHAVGWACMWVN